MVLEGQVGTGITIYPGVSKMIKVVVLAHQASGTTPHYMGTTPTVGRPSPSDPAGEGSVATANATDITVTLDNIQEIDITFIVPAMII